MIIERRVLLTAEAIPAFPLFVDAGPLDLPENTNKITFYCTVSNNAVRPIFQVLYGNDFVATLVGENARDTVIDGSAGLVIVPPDATFDFYLGRSRGPLDSGGITYIVACKNIPGGLRQITLQISDDAGPGTVDVTVSGSS